MVTTTTPGGQRVFDLHLHTDGSSPGHVHSSARVESVHTGYRASSGSCVCSGVRVRSGSTPLLVSPPVALESSLPPLPPSPALPCLPCVEGRQRAAPHSSFPPTTAPLQTLHMDVWGPTRISGQGRERYFLVVVDDYTRYTSVFPLHSKGQIVDVLIPWIRAVRLQLRERFNADLPVLRLHSERGGEFSSDLLRDFCRGEGMLLSFKIRDSPQKNGIDERRIRLVMEVARTSMIHAAAPNFLWPFAVRYAAHQLNLWPRVSFLETSPTLRWTGKVGDASVFRVWGSRAFVRDTSADKLSARAIPCVDPLLGTALVEVAVGSGVPRGAASRGAVSGGAELGCEELGSAEPVGVEPGGAELEGVDPGGAESEGVESGGAEPQDAVSSGGHAGALPRLSPQQLREWLVRHAHLRSGATAAGGIRGAGVGGGGVTAGAGGTGGTAATGPGGARTRGTGAAGTGGVGAGGAEAGGTGAGGAGAGGARVGGTGAGGAGAGGAGAVDPGGTVRPQPYFVPLLEQVLGAPCVSEPG
ncbi:unnamed protein product [Closterium sp. NIES-54]